MIVYINAHIVGMHIYIYIYMGQIFCGCTNGLFQPISASKGYRMVSVLAMLLLNALMEREHPKLYICM